MPPVEMVRLQSTRFLLFLSLFSLMSLPAICLAAGLEEVYSLAKKHDPVFQRALLQKMAVEERKKQVLAQLFPVINGTASYTKTYQNIESVNNDVVAKGDIDYGTTAFGLKLEQPVFHRESYVAWQKSDEEILQAQSQFLAAEQALILRVAERYFVALRALDQRNLVAAEKAAVDKHYELASGRYDMGLVPITDLHDAKARKTAVMAKSIKAENILDDAMQGLEELTGQHLALIRPLVDDFALSSPEPQDLESWLKAGKESNLSIMQQQHAVEVAQLEVKRLNGGHYPNLDLVGSFESKDADGSIYGGGTDGEVTDLMVLLTLPLYQGGAVASKVREAEIYLSSSRQELVRVERAVNRETRAAFLGVNGALGQLAALQESVVASRLALEAKQDGFMSGLYSTISVLDAERDLSFASIDFAEARYDYLINNLKLKQAVGSLQEEHLLQLERLLVK